MVDVEQERAAALCAKCGGPVEMEGSEGRATCKPCGMPTDLCTCESQQAEEQRRERSSRSRN